MSAEAIPGRPRLTWRWTELRLLLPLLLLVPLGFAVTHIATTGEASAGPLTMAFAYVALMFGAHVVLVVARYRGDQLILPLVATIGGIGLVMLHRLAPQLATTQAFGLNLDVAQTQLLWFAVGVVAMLAVALLLREDGWLRHYKYTWALGGVALLLFTFLFGVEVNGARLWIYLGPIGFQPGEFIKLVLVVFIAAYLAENRALLRDAVWRIGPIR
ncbi:MAG TPA: FtsW/RodA/SpoVE family cell cycle protein, partial [Candidatus Limnocylindria bacterium]